MVQQQEKQEKLQKAKKILGETKFGERQMKKIWQFLARMSAIWEDYIYMFIYI